MREYVRSGSATIVIEAGGSACLGDTLRQLSELDTVEFGVPRIQPMRGRKFMLVIIKGLTRSQTLELSRGVNTQRPIHLVDRWRYGQR